MNILIVKLSPVEGLNSSMIRTLALAKGLSSLGHKIDFITIPISNSHVKNNSRYSIENINFIRASQNIIYDSIISEKSTNIAKKIIIKLLRKIYHAFNLYNYTYSIARKIDISILEKREYDIIISSSDPPTSHIAIKNLIKQGLKYTRWIQYWGDPMAVDITNKSIYPKQLIAMKEYNLIKSADKIVYVSPFTLKVQEKLFPKLKNKMIFLPIPYFQENICKDAVNNQFTIGYYGAYHSDVRDIMPLYNSCIKLSDIVHLDIIGDTDLNLGDAENINIYPRGDVSMYEEKADLLVCILNKRGSQIPGKIYHYAATNKPILVLLDGDYRNEMREYLESFERYIICDNSTESIIKAIINISKNQQVYYPCKFFNPETIAKKFLL